MTGTQSFFMSEYDGKMLHKRVENDLLRASVTECACQTSHRAKGIDGTQKR